jgi:2,4-dienoyl-CoA reductase-like NADH-dependent reductase (Old Yellow Enzyme family)
LGKSKLRFRCDSGRLFATVAAPSAETTETPGIIEQYRNAAVKAQRAGFDGVEVMAANGHLVDQFLQDNSNKRTDHYGGSIENRTQLLVEIVEALIDDWGAPTVLESASRQAERITTWRTAIRGRYSVMLQSGSMPLGWPISM